MHSQAGGSFAIHLDGKTGKVARSWVHVKQKGERQGQEIQSAGQKREGTRDVGENLLRVKYGTLKITESGS